MNKKIIIIGIVFVVAFAISSVFFARLNSVTGQAVANTDTMDIATTPQAWSGFIFIAEKEGYFSDQGLKVNIHYFQTGKLALDAMLGGGADLITVADFPIALAGLSKQNITILATIASNMADFMIARKDSGIESPIDLKGKKIATTRGGGPMYTTHLLLSHYNISLSDVDIVYLNPSELVQALVRKDIDAFSCFPPFYLVAQEALPNNTVVFDPSEIYTESWDIVIMSDFDDTLQNQLKLKKFFAAISKAEQFYAKNPDESIMIISNFTGISENTIRKIILPLNLEIKLEPSLANSLDKEARWAIANQLASNTTIPEYMDMFDPRYIIGKNKIITPISIR